MLKPLLQASLPKKDDLDDEELSDFYIIEFLSTECKA